MTDTNPAAPPRRDRTRIALVASLGLNLLVIGLVAGLALKGPPPPAGPGTGMDAGPRGYADALPDPFRRDLGRALRQSRGDWAGARERMGRMRADLAAALAAEPYDPAAVARVLDEGDALRAALARRGSALVAAQVARMDAAERADYARRLLEPPRRRGPEAERDGGRDGGRNGGREAGRDGERDAGPDGARP